MLVGIFDLLWEIIEAIAKLAIKLFNYLKNTKPHSTIQRYRRIYKQRITTMYKKHKIIFTKLMVK